MLTLAVTGRGAERLGLGEPVSINGQPVKVIADTCAARSYFFRTCLERLEVPVGSKPAAAGNPREFRCAKSGPCTLRVGETVLAAEAPLNVVELGFAPPIDGLLGWDYLRTRIWAIDWSRGELQALAEAPAKCRDWQRLRLDGRRDVCAILFERKDGQEGQVLLDTGDFGSLSLSKRRWKSWVKQQGDAPYTLSAVATSWQEILVSEVRWAKAIEASPLSFGGVTVQAAPEHYSDSEPFEAIVGLAALQHFDVLLDGPANALYVSARKNVAPACYNRLGAVFVPRNAGSDALLARLARNSPAARAGLKEDDELLAVDGAAVGGWRRDPDCLPDVMQPAGARLQLKVRRRGRELNIAVELQDYLLDPPQARD